MSLTIYPGQRDELCWLLDASYAMVTVMMDRAEEIVNFNCFNFYSCVQRRPEETSSVSYRTRHQEQVVKTRLPLSPEQHQSVWIWRNMPFLNATEIGIMYDTRNTESRDRYGQNWAHEHQPLKYFRLESLPPHHHNFRGVAKSKAKYLLPKWHRWVPSHTLEGIFRWSGLTIRTIRISCFPTFFIFGIP